jgi:hypothetical protein
MTGASFPQASDGLDVDPSLGCRHRWQPDATVRLVRAVLEYAGYGLRRVARTDADGERAQHRINRLVPRRGAAHALERLQQNERQ